MCIDNAAEAIRRCRSCVGKDECRLAGDAAIAVGRIDRAALVARIEDTHVGMTVGRIGHGARRIAAHAAAQCNALLCKCVYQSLRQIHALSSP